MLAARARDVLVPLLLVALAVAIAGLAYLGTRTSPQQKDVRPKDAGSAYQASTALGTRADGVETIHLISPGLPTNLSTSFDFAMGARPPADVQRVEPSLQEPFALPHSGRLPTLTKTVLGDGKVVRVTLTLEEVKLPGRYDATVVIKLGELVVQTRKVSILATYLPQLSLSGKSAGIAGSTCRWCALTRFFAPETANRSRTLHIANESPTPVQAVVEFVPGDTPRTGFAALRDGQNNCSSRLELPLQPTERRPITLTAFINEDQRRAECGESAVPVDPLPAGSYPADLVITARPRTNDLTHPPLLETTTSGFTHRNEARHVVTANVNVRVGVLPVILLIVLGILTGRAFSRLAAAGFQTKLDYYERLSVLRDRIDLLPEATRTILHGIRQDLIHRALSGEAATTLELEVDRLERQVQRLDAFGVMREEIIRRGGASPTEPHLKAALDAINEAIGFILRRPPDFGNADAKFDEAAKALAAAPPPGAPASSFLDTVRSRMTALTRMTGQVRAARRDPSAFERRLMKLLAGLAGTGEEGARAYFWIRAILHVVLLVVLALYGVWYHYSTTDAQAFGSTGIAPFVNLFLWGITADIINKTLQNITFTRKTS
jgi:hypothetical protein